MGKARLPMSKLTDQDRAELRALFSQLADLQADAIIEELAEQPWKAQTVKQEAHALITSVADLHAETLHYEWVLADIRADWLKTDFLKDQWSNTTG